jgi:hypothetical protein
MESRSDKEILERPDEDGGGGIALEAKRRIGSIVMLDAADADARR